MEVLGIGSPFLDSIVPVSDAFLNSIAAEKGSFEQVTQEEFARLIAQAQVRPIEIPGGSGANVIKGLARLGHQCGLMGKIGKDPVGQRLTQNLIEHGITPYLSQSHLATGQVLALVTPDGQRTMRAILGATQDLTPLDLISTAFKQTKWVHIEGYTLLKKELLEQTLALAKKAGARLSFDLANFELVRKFKPEIVQLIASSIHLLFCSAEEAFALTQCDPQQSCALLKDLCDVVVVTMNRAGCWVGNRTQCTHFPAYPVDPVDTTGAGDLFAAGFLHGYLLNYPLSLCAEIGARVAAVVVQVPGAEIPGAEWNILKKNYLY